MNSITIKLLSILAFVALATVSGQAAGTDTWVGNTDANWNTGGNWTTSGGSTPPGTGDSLVFGAAGSKGASLNNNITSLSVNNITINSGAPAYTFAGSALTLTGTLTDNNASNNVTISLALGGAGGLNHAAGATTVYLSGNNTYNGATTISSGAGVEIDAQAAADANSDYTINGKMEAYSNGGNPFNMTIGALNGSGNVYCTRGSGSAASATLTVGSTGASGSFSGVINNNVWGATITHGVTKVGAGTQTLSGANTYTGPTTISAGTLQIGNGGTSGSLSTSSAITDNGVLAFNRTDSIAQGTAFSGAAITGSGALTQAGSGTLTLNALNAFTGNIVINAGTIAVGGGGIAGNAASSITSYLGDIGSGQSRSIIINNGGNLTFTGGNVFGYGSATLSGVTLVVNQGGVFQTGPTSGSGYFSKIGPVNLNGGTISVGNGDSGYKGALALLGTVTVGGNTPSTIGNLSGASTYDVVNIGQSNPSITSDTFNVATTGGSGADLTVSAGLADGANGGGASSITKTGAGTMALTGANTYSGTTTINAGTLLVDNTSGSGTGSSSVVVNNANTTLGGSGTISGAVILNAGTILSPGTNSTTGLTLTCSGGVTFSGGAKATFDLSTSASGANDKVAVTGTLTIGSADTITINPITASTLDTADYTLATATSVAGSGTPTLAWGTSTPANPGRYSIVMSSTTVKLHYTVPAGSPPVVGAVTFSPVSPVYTGTVVTASATVANSGTGLTYQWQSSSDNSTWANASGASTSATYSPGTSVSGTNYYRLIATDSYGSTTNAGAALSVIIAPAVNSASASPATLGHYQTTAITVNVTPASGQSITSVTVGVDGLGGAGDPVTLTGPGGNGAGNWIGTFTVSGALAAGSYTVSGVVNQNNGGSAVWSATGITVTNANEVWNGLGSDNKWSTGGNWVSGVQPNTSDNVTFAGKNQTTANMNTNFTVGSLTFSTNAGSFDITNAANTLTLASGLTNNSTNAQTLDVPVALNGAQTINAAAGNVSINRAVSDSGAGFTLVGTNTLTLSGTNTYSGATTISNATLAIGGAGQLGSGSYSAAITNNGALNDNSSANQTLSGIISGTGSLTNSGSGTLTLSVGNNYGGGTTISAGTMKFSNASAFGPGTITLNGGTIQAGGGYTLANNLAVTAASVFDMEGNNTTVSGNISGSGPLTLNNSSYAATFTLTGNNGGYGGTMTFNNGNAVSFNSANVGSASAAWVFNDSAGDRVRINIGNGILNFGSISGSGQMQNDASGTASIISVGALNTSTTFSGTINNGGGTLALIKVGSGSLTLTGANTYSGPTTVSNGTLTISTAQTGSGSFAVNDGAALNIFGPFGSSIAMSSLTLGAGGSSVLGLGGLGSATALVNVASLTTHGTVTVNIASVSGTGQFPLIKYSGSLGGSGYAFVLGTLPYGVTASLVNNTANKSVDLNVTTNIYGGGSKHVLFLGNSFTGYNNLYVQYSNMVVSAGYPAPQVSCYWVGSDDLGGLSIDSTALALIAQGGWDYVVLQEQSEEPCIYAQSADNMDSWMQTWDFFYDDIKFYNPNATIVMYETWAWAPGSIPSGCGTDQASMQALLTYAYQTAATNLVNSGRTNVIVAHVGDARLINDNYANLNMYWDASHPNGPGTYLAGLVIFSTTYDADPQLVTYLEPNTANGSAVNATDGAYIRSLARYEAYLPQPNPPLYPQATTATNIPVSLMWNPSPIAQLFSSQGQPAGYNIKRGTVSGGPYQLIGNTTGTNYTDTAVTNGVTYYYVVSATNSAGESPNSFETSVVPRFITPSVPATPANLVATASNAQVVLGWSASSGATGYNLKSSTTNGGPYAVIAANVSGLAYTNSGLVNGTMYYFVVSATNSAGESANSTPISAQPVSSVTTNLTFNIVGNQIRLNWPADHTGWRLQMNTSLSTANWQDISGANATNQISIQATNANAFFRLVYP